MVFICLTTTIGTLGAYTRCNIRRNIDITKQYINVNVILLTVMITCVGIAGADISSANWHANAGESITGIDSDTNQTRIGVLIIAHGSSSESWCAPVRATVANVSLPYPVELGFLEKVPGESIEDAVDKLNSHGVSKIVAVPLFVSSSSNHISEIKYILGLGDAIPGEDDLVQVNTTANITLTSAMDDHWIISSILADNAADLSEDPGNETAVLVAHGVSDNEEIFAGWNESSASLAEQTILRLRHLHNLDIEGVRYSFINLNETLHPEFAVKAVVKDISSDSTPIVLSRILSPGYHTKRKIPALLENLTYLYDNEKTLATHPALAEWIDISVYEAVSDLLFSAYSGESGEIVELTLEEAVAGHDGGKLCPCVAVAWRASQFALSEVWGDVDQSDLKITSAHPSDGHEETFLYILNNSTADYMIEMPEGTDPKNLTTENYVYTFTSKSTGDSVTVRVKDEVFPDKLFDLRKKCKAGTATPDEKKAFKLIKDELKDGFLYLPMDELFEVEVVEHAQSDTGVLIIAHGSSSESWCAPVRATVANVSLPYPVELGFLEKVPGESIEDAVDKLNSHGVSEIIAVPLFVSSSSNHISEIKYILGLGDAIPGEEDLVQVNTTANITLTGAMDDHWIISSILADHAANLSEDPGNETVVTISHGVSDNEEIFTGWNLSGASLADQTLLMLRYLHNLDIGGSRHSLARLNETLHPELAARAVVEDISATSMPVVLPLFLSHGYNTNTKIPALLENLTYTYDSEKTLASHPALAEWIDISVYEAVSDLSFSVYDGESGEIVELIIEGAAAMHDGGKLCPSVAASWRASQLALSDIWGCVPRSDLEITSAHPSDGHEATFLYILENSTDDYVVEMPEGTDITNLSAENYVYTFVRKSTGDSVTVRVKEGVIPGEFLELRKKIRAKTATPNEIKVFKLIKDELKARLMYLPACELFDSEVMYSKFDTGILVVAHGSPRETWCAPVRAAAHNVDLPYPVELGFLEFVPGETINAAVDRLDKHGVEKIIAVPLFISSHSDHIAEVEYLLGLRDSLPGAHDASGGHGAHSASEMGVMRSNEVHAGVTTFASEKEVLRSIVQKDGKYFISRVAVAGHPGEDEEEELVPVKSSAAITLTGAIDDHWLVGEILADRARALSTNPANETVVLVAHGADNETDIAGWINDSMSLAEQVDLRLRFMSGEEPALDLAGVRYSFLFHNKTLHPDIKTRAVVEDVSTTSDALVVPFMVSPGFFTGTFIPQVELANLTYAYDGDALLPHPKITDLIEIKASAEFTDLAFPVYDRESGETVNITIKGAAASYDGNTTCCVALAFRASQLALSDEHVGTDRNDIEIVSANPSEAQEAVFLYILGSSTADYVVKMPVGTDPMNLTEENFVYTFTRKSTGESVTVSVKDGVLPDELPDLRRMCRAGTATPDEKKAFALTRREIKDKFRCLPMDELFETESPSLNGDVNGDSVITTTDATITLEMAAYGEWVDVADVTGDGKVTSLNALMILHAAADKIEV
ncbi:MAG: hypothetical protein EF813_02720 [Methanosarcinales archaeon]|nr:MAG: hypothetical protein EF813_02720 [Methanosarcinales archaeon]